MGCYQFWVILKTHPYRFLYIHIIFISLGQIHRSAVSGSYEKCMFKLKRTTKLFPKVAFLGVYKLSYFSLSMCESLISPHPWYHLVLSLSLNCSLLSSYEMVIVLICFFVTPNGVGHLFMCLSSFVKCFQMSSFIYWVALLSF